MENKNLIIGAIVVVAAVLLFVAYGRYRQKPADTQPPADVPPPSVPPVAPDMQQSLRTGRVSMPEWDV